MSFEFDQRNLPDNLKSTEAQDAFAADVLTKLNESGAAVNDGDPLHGTVVGMLVLDGHTDTSAADFADGFWAVRGETSGSTAGGKAYKDVYHDVAAQIGKIAGRKGIVFYQELADVSRRLLKNTDNVPADSPGFLGQVGLFDDEYMKSGPQGVATLDLPILSAAGAGAPDDIQGPNIAAVTAIAVSLQCDGMRMFEVVDRVAETWWNGQLPTVVTGEGSQALDKYYFAGENRLSDSARHMQYARVLGVPGGEVSTEVQPNAQFNTLWLRFIASLGEYDRQQRVADIVGSQRTSALSLTSEGIRQAGRNLAANASLYGWGGTQFAARRLAAQIASAFEILNAPDIQKAYGVEGPYQVIERVATEQWGAAPNIVKSRTLAEAYRNVLNLVAKYASIWSGSTGKPLFSDPSTESNGNLAMGSLSDSVDRLTAAIVAGTSGARPTATQVVPVTTSNSGSGTNVQPASADISNEDRDELLRQAANVIAVTGLKSDTMADLSQPFEAQYSPSIPTATTSAPASTDGHSSSGIDQLTSMLLAGQHPSAEVVKNLVLSGTQQ